MSDQTHLPASSSGAMDHSSSSMSIDGASRKAYPKVHATYCLCEHLEEGEFEDLEDLYGMEPAAQKQEIKGLSSEMQAGDVWYVVDAHWWRKWKEFTGYDVVDGQEFDGGENPGPLSNGELLSPDDDLPEVRENAQESEDYVLLSQQTYKCIMKW
jgi:hypothetical protein